MSFQWVDSYCTGDAALDGEKKALFALSEKLEATDDWIALRQVILALYKQMKALFEMEQAWMQRNGFPEFAVHREQHAEFLERLADRSTDVGKGHMNKKAILKVMTDWAHNHVTGLDAQLVSAMRKQA